MATALKDAIKRIRTYKKLSEQYGCEDSYNRVIKREWDNIRQVYRNDEMVTVYEVENLYSETVNFWDLKELMSAIDDIAQDLIGLEITIKVKEMRGTDIGRLPLLDE